MKNLLGKGLSMGLSLLFGVFLVSDAYSETNPKKTVETLEAISVTARKAEESAKDVPFSLTVINDTELENRRLNSFEEVLRQTPGVEVYSYGSLGSDIMRIRGVGSLYLIGSDDTSVLINMDGVPQSLSTASMSILDIERIEVMKGPQGTLMGRNSEAGAVNIITKKPTRYPEGYIKGEYGTENTFNTEAAVSGPVTETLSARFAAKYSGFDNQVEYYGTDDPISEPRDIIARGSLLWEPTDKTDATLILAHEEKDNRTEAMLLAPYDDEQRLYAPKGSLDANRESQRATLDVNHDFGNMVLTSVTGYVQVESSEDRLLYDRLLSRALLGMDIVEGNETLRESSMDTFYQEFRLSSKPENDVFWVTGLSYYHSDRDLSNQYNYKYILGYMAMNGRIASNYKTTDYGLFGEITYPVTERLKLTGGLRYTWEEKEYKSNWTPSGTNPFAAYYGPTSDSDEMSSSFFTGRASLGYAVTENVNTYLTYARGYKAKAYQDLATGYIYSGDNSDLLVDAAKVDSYELGMKLETADSGVGLNIALFFNDIKDDHVSYVDLTTMTNKIGNNDTQTMGAEVEGFWKPGKGFTITAGGGYTDAEITGVPDSSQNVKEGNAIPDTPEWNAVVSISHNLPLPTFWGLESPSLLTTLTDRYVGKREGDAANSFQLDAYNQLSFRTGIISKYFEFYVWGENLLDKVYELYGYNLGTSVIDASDVIAGVGSRGRTLGIGVVYHF
ncbi:TonB-dependent receptor [Dethiosulfatarculus sandiegensis]|uniref:Ligand-gated channel protein n=1 Tax=Dethiosulfatarculus sandiegensis TaxID=1429043 RepID=A0A0D2GAH3_9BACT|nr:TonB-dependent receptor [Dethiosulfatarculus sandiegensis]KIX11882.1 ligand-gated channel protein [Dethiosulfatarculus sandiegensis]